MTKDQVLASLPNLSPDDLKAIRAVIGGLLGDGGTVGHPDDPTGYEAWLRAAIQGLTGTPTPASNNAFKKNAPVAIAFMRKYFAEALENKVTATALMRYLLVLLTDNMKAMRVPVTKSTIPMHL